MSLGDRARAAISAAAPWITRQRWYGEKARPLTSLFPEFVVDARLEGHEIALTLVRFTYEQGPDARYFIPVVLDDQVEGGVRDALREPAFLAWVLQGFRDERTLRADGDWRWRTFDVDALLAGTSSACPRVLAAEQSNTSVVFGDRLVAKIFRRLQAGINPDLEIGEFLTRHGHFPYAPALFGVVELDEGGTITAIAALQEFVANQGDGWEWLLARLSEPGEEAARDLLDAVALLGRRTGELHVALAAHVDDPAFAPEPFTNEDARALNDRIVAEMEQSVEELARRLPPEEVAALHRGIGAIKAGASSLVGTRKIRVHGDYHLGQTLRTMDDDFCIIDFEGEPSRTIEERRQKQPALKDVAGMLRSLDYAVATVSGRVDDPARQAALRIWGKQAATAFLAAYRDALSVSERLMPANERRFDDGLKLMVLEKALYEVRYELNNRPDWLPIPLNALRRLAGVPVPGSAQYGPGGVAR